MQMKFDEMEYSALLEEIFKRTPSVQQTGFARGAYKPGLEGMEEFDGRLGHPWRSYRCIHIAGTNGKGSVASMLASSLAVRPANPGEPAGLKVGLYTSPHLVDFRERIKAVDGNGWRMPSKEEVWEFFHRFDTSSLSFFEMTTGLAFWWFERQKVDVAVVETGLGGRLDSTNIITPVLSVITSIGLDHCALLGDTRAAIAREKAGIFKKGVPALVAAEDGETAPVFREAAASAGSPLHFADHIVTGLDETSILSGMDLQGPCQAQNLHTALAALGLSGLAPEGAPGALVRALEKTAERTGLRGRWERLCAEPEVICDIGHNPPALKMNFERLEATGRPLTIVYGVMADKDLAAISEFMPERARYILAAPAIPRAMPVHELYLKLKELRPSLHTVQAPSVALAIQEAMSGAAPGELVYIGGSTFVVTEAIEHFNNRLP